MALSLPFTLGSILLVSDVLSAVSPLSVILIRCADRVNGGRAGTAYGDPRSVCATTEPRSRPSRSRVHTACSRASRTSWVDMDDPHRQVPWPDGLRVGDRGLLDLAPDGPDEALPG